MRGEVFIFKFIEQTFFLKLWLLPFYKSNRPLEAVCYSVFTVKGVSGPRRPYPGKITLAHILKWLIALLNTVPLDSVIFPNDKTRWTEEI